MKDKPFDIREFLGADFEAVLGVLPDAPIAKAESLVLSQFGGWVLDEASHGSEELDRFVMRSGLPRVDVRITPQTLSLDWSAKIPKFLRPGMSIEEFYDKFLPTVTSDLPHKMLLNLSQESITVARYRQSTRIGLGIRGGEDVAHLMNDEKSTALLAVDLLSNSNRINSMRLVAGYGQGDFALSMNYGSEERMGLILPLSGDGIKCLTGSMAEWVLSTNERAADLGSLAQPAARFSEILKARAQGALDRRNRKTL